MLTIGNIKKILYKCMQNIEVLCCFLMVFLHTESASIQALLFTDSYLAKYKVDLGHLIMDTAQLANLAIFAGYKHNSKVTIV
jgi:hypothetical protein